MAIIDWVILIVVILSVVSAAKAGLVLEVCTLAGLILGLLVASWDYEKLTPWMGQWIHSKAVNETLSFIAIALGVMIVAGMVGRLIRWSVKSVGLGWMDRLAGAAFGLVKGMRAGDGGGNGDGRVLAQCDVVPAVALCSGVLEHGACCRGSGSCRTGRSDQERCGRPAEGAAGVDEAGGVVGLGKEI
jgi:hypothetical protein